nr:MAG TPA: Protein of unknown function (DUF2800) [Caudoviricetes sp.]
MGGHAERKHSLLSPSGAHRWMACTPSVMLERRFPDTGSQAAEEGTLAHELAELKVRNYFYTVEFGKRKLTSAVKKLKESDLWDEEMMRYTDDYLDYIKSAAMKFPSSPHVDIERRVPLDRYIPHLPDEDGASGSADCILVGNGIIHVIDFKYGKSPDGRVSAEWNPQMLLYALGAYEAYRVLYRIQAVRMSIVQPRLSDGLSEWECSLDELLQFGEYVKERASLAIKGEGEFMPGSKTCRYCRARGECRARAEKNVELAFLTGTDPALISDAEMGDYLRKGRDVARWLSDIQETALKKCLAGKTVPGWKAVEGRSTRAWTDVDEAFGVLESRGVPQEMLWERKPLTVAQVEKVLGKKEFAEKAGDCVVKKPGSPALAEESDKRPAITNKVSAAEAFKEEC